MSVTTDLQKIRADFDEFRAIQAQLKAASDRHEEQISGKRGTVADLEELGEEVRSLRRATWTVGAGIIISAVGFALTVLTVFAP